MRIVTFTTDFGDNFALSQLEAVALSTNPDLKLVTISNEVTQFSILEGAFILSKTHHLFPKGTVHVGVVDPGVGSTRDGIVIETEDYFFVGPNNGLFSQSIEGLKNVYKQSLKQLRCYKIKEDFVNSNHSNTFHGRDIFARVAALITKGKDIEDFAQKIDSSKITQVNFLPNQVLHIDPYGNIKLNHELNGFKVGDALKIKTQTTEFKAPLVKSFSDVPENEFLVYLGSHDTLEIARNLASANEVLNLEVGDTIQIEKIQEKC